VERIQITDPATGRDVERPRITRDGFFVNDVRAWEVASKLGVERDRRGCQSASDQRW
jgi:hypothetical protein